MSLLEIRNLSVSFATRSGAFLAVDGINLSVNRNEIVSIVGESGSGKSVAMLAVMGLLPWTATIRADVMRFEGLDLLTLSDRDRRKRLRKDVAMIFQEPMTSLNPCFTVGFQIGESLKTHLGLDRAARRKRSIELLEAVGMTDPEQRLSAFPHQLSGGMSQRVMIAMALASQPKLLIADEPTTALDVTIQAQILDLLMSIQKQNGMGLVLITHDMGWLKPRSGLLCNMPGSRLRCRIPCRCFSSRGILTQRLCWRLCRNVPRSRACCHPFPVWCRGSSTVRKAACLRRVAPMCSRAA